MATTKTAKTTKASTPDFTAMPNPFEAFTVNTPSFDVPAAARDFAEKGISQAREAYAKMKANAEETTDLVEDTYETAREGAFTLGAKALDVAKANSDATFAFAKDMFGAKTFADVIEMQTTFARQQFEATSAQFKDMQETAQKLFAATTKPVSAHVEKTFKDMKVV
ncbi:MAG: phasin [Bauldia litoralis]|uniref:phasin n=1 Tax=Bauldia litoralis TaxID=665467 RepID=UPI003298F26F